MIMPWSWVVQQKSGGIPEWQAKPFVAKALSFE